MNMKKMGAYAPGVNPAARESMAGSQDVSGTAAWTAGVHFNQNHNRAASVRHSSMPMSGGDRVSHSLPNKKDAAMYG